MYKYDAESKLIKSYVYDSETMTNSFGADVIYDLRSRVSSVQLTFDYVAPSGTFFDPTSYTYTYSEEDDTLSQLMIIGGGGLLATIEPVYDRFGRTTSKVIDFNLGNANAFYNELSYDYKTNGYKESGLISQLISKAGQTSTGTLTTTTYNYTYDDNGNIIQITDASGVIQNKYTYDDLGQLIREDNRALNRSYVWTYDRAGNILSKKTYAFTTGTLGTALDTIYYSYKDSEWWDLLIEYEGVEIVYDLEGVDEEGIGNPTQIGEYSLTWEGRQLKSFANPEMYYTINYTYNSDGIRTAKEVRDDDMYDLLLHEYTLNGTQIVKETVYNDTGDGYTEIYTLVYIYDETGAPIGMKYRTPYMAVDTYTCFFFEKNMQGDIVSVYNSSGVKVIAYTYDAWGNCTASYPNGASAASIARYNPFRYRGYYYDTETEFYYLQSRYYNPTWGRFINEDSYVSTGQGILGYNMFAYCRNNPVTRKDRLGTDDIDVTDDEDYNPLNDLHFSAGGGGAGGGAPSNGSSGVSSGGGGGSSGGGGGSSGGGGGSSGGGGGSSGGGGGSSGGGGGSSGGGGGSSGGGGGGGVATALPQNGITVNSSIALDMAIAYLGPGYVEVAPNRFVSLDGYRQVRMSNSDLLGLHAGAPHINFDRLYPSYKSVHVYFVDY